MIILKSMATEATTSTSTFTLVTSDNVKFPLEETMVIEKIGLIKDIIDEDDNDDNDDNEFPLLCVTSKDLQIILNYLSGSPKEFKIPKPVPDNDLAKFIPEWDAAFVADFDEETIYSLLKACDYMIVPSFLNLLCAKIACGLHAKTPDDIREYFKVNGDPLHTNYPRDGTEKCQCNNCLARTKK